MLVTKTVALTAAALTTAAAHAQPFVHNIAEPLEAAEVANDLTLFDTGEISFVGTVTRDVTALSTEGWNVISDPAGFPIVSYLFDDPDAFTGARPFANRQDPTDAQLIVAQDRNQVAGAPSDIVLHKFDPFTGVPAYQWRYPMITFGDNIGMELADEAGFIAAAIDSPFGGTIASILSFDTASGLPNFYNGYATFNAPVADPYFVDVAVDPENGDIYAVGSITADFDTTSPGTTKLLIARVTSFGAPVWFNAYDAFLPESFGADIHGASIELTNKNEVAVTASYLDPTGFAETTLSLIVDKPAGVPLIASVFDPFGTPISPATSSLETYGDGSLLVSGTTIDASGTPVPVMWSIDEGSTALQWSWATAEGFGTGNTAIPQPGEGTLLAGNIFPFAAGPIGGLEDALLARTDFSGKGLCPLPLELPQRQPAVTVLQIPVEPIQLQTPQETQIRILRGQPVQELVCEPNTTTPCPGDTNGDNLVDPTDLFTVLANFGMAVAGGPADGDVWPVGAPDGFVGPDDLFLVLANFGNTCP